MEYNDFINIAELKNLKIQYELDTDEIDDSGTLDKYYYLYAFDDKVKYECNINTEYNISGVIDFETNYKSKSNKNLIETDDNGNPLISTTLGYVPGMQKAMQMYKFNITAGIDNIFDVLVDTEKVFLGGEYWIAPDSVINVHQDDYVEFSIIDKDDVLGLFSIYGLSTANGDILTLSKFVINNIVKKGSADNGYYCDLAKVVRSKGIVKQGLYLRTTYTSYGTSDILLLNNYIYYRQ